MKGSDVFLMLGVAGLTLAGAAIWARRAQAADAPPSKFLPGFSWDKKRQAYTKTNASGQIEVLPVSGLE